MLCPETVLLLLIILMIVWMPAVCAQNGPKLVRKIEVVGTKRTNPQMIKRTMRTKVGKPLVKEELVKDLHRIWEMGFFKPDGVKRHLVEKDDGYYIMIGVKEREYVISVDFRGNVEFDDEDLKEQVKTKAGGFLFEYFVKKRDIELIRELYKSKSYYNVEADSEVRQVEGGVVVVYTIKEKTPARIEDVVFLGNKHVPGYELKRVMETDFYGFFPDRIYRDRIFNSDIENIRNLYRVKGFLESRIDFRVVFSPEEALPPREKILEDEKRLQRYGSPDSDMHIYIYIMIEEGPRYTFGTISVVGNREEVVPASRIQRELSAEEGTNYSLMTIQKDISAIRKIYGDKGYAFAKITHEENFNFKERNVNISYMIDEGNLYYIQEVEIIGNIRTKMQVILREIDIFKGEKYSRTKEIRARLALNRIGLFRRVTVSKKPGSAADLVIIVIEVEEEQTGAFEVMLSYNEYQKLAGTLVLRQNNFDILGMFKGHFTGAGHQVSVQYFGSPVQTDLSLSFKNPRLFDGKNNFSLRLSDREREFSEYTEDSLIQYFAIGREVLRNLDVGLGFSIKDIDIFDVEDAPLTIRQEEGLSKIRSVSLTGSYNRVSYYAPYFPSEGYSLGAEIEYAGDFLNANTQFVTVGGSFSLYHTLTEKEDGSRTVWKLKLKGKAANELGDAEYVPLSERIALGGTYTVRGYQWYSIGPYEDGDNIRGDVYALLSTEISYPLKWDPVRRKNLVHGVIFFDAGGVWSEVTPAREAFEDFDLDKVRSSVGIGLRLFPGGMPIPIEIYWSYPFAQEDDKLSRLQIGIFGMAF